MANWIGTDEPESPSSILDQVPQVLDADVARVEGLDAVGALDAQEIIVGALGQKIELADRVDVEDRGHLPRDGEVLEAAPRPGA
jgi:hypothetical protein